MPVGGVATTRGDAVAAYWIPPQHAQAAGAGNDEAWSIPRQFCARPYRRPPGTIGRFGWLTSYSHLLCHEMDDSVHKYDKCQAWPLLCFVRLIVWASIFTEHD